jgi:dihydrofolate synthase / folylpolyglutamate synthase
MNLAEWLALQESVHARSIDLGLERVARVGTGLGLTKPSYAVVTVAGTNGKGSTVSYLDAIFRAAGYRTGSLTSPHLLHYNERVRLDGAQASDAALIAVFERIERARGGTTLTFFEYNTLAALLLFAQSRVDVALLEVGLGGRLDATNIVDADVGVLCSVGLDHRDWLGDTVEAIGTEKAGIFRPRRPAVLGTADMPATVFAAIERFGARPVVAQRDFDWTVGTDHWSYRGLRAPLERLSPPALAGAIQFRNAATALAAYESLPGSRPLTSERVSAALRGVRLPGRFEILRLPGAQRDGERVSLSSAQPAGRSGARPDAGVEWILDVSHNEPAAKVLAGNLSARAASGRTLAVCSILRDKDVEAVGRALAPVIDEWIVCGVPGPRGSTAAELAQRLATSVKAPTLAGSVQEGCELARSRAELGDRVVVFGSFAAVGSALEWLGYTSLP